ncbi:hypothetical protein CPAR01_08180 [Colletotrichum paranaense]|uniref:Uncharacterized protein n=1 Tax=Colletotrichum paranaense TaxID=1914294 RepID=A0ABQ9SJK5_9PEZI|nr:uncharacterized protein CPAR01_08180 [Colletotrichum paranaense]KAK1538067.1 hypothetical protein CPAR01_08180 [Colletotrichum paranaense]
MLVVAQDRAELAGSDKANVRRECCHAILHPAVWTREYKTRQPSRLFLPVARGCVLKSCCPGGRIQDYQRRDEEIVSSNGVPLMIQRARQYKKIKGRDIGNNTHAAPEGANEVETWRDAQRTTVPQARHRERAT